MAQEESRRERATRAVAIALVGWATYRIALAVAFLFAGMATLEVDPTAPALVERYGALKTHLPATSTVGYIGPPETASMRQMVARYALAPVVVDTDDAHRVVVVDLENDQALARYVEGSHAMVRVHPRPGLAIVERPGVAP